MSYTFTVETGTADPDANSYVDLTDANDYAETTDFEAAWTALTDEEKQDLLIRSSRYIDRIVQWNGQRVDQDSGLRWPRAGVYDEDGFEISSDEIPGLLKDSVVETALYFANGTDWTQPTGTEGFTQIEVDVINLKFDKEYTRPSLPNFIVDMLSPLGTVNRGSRPAFKKIVRT